MHKPMAWIKVYVITRNFLEPRPLGSLKTYTRSGKRGVSIPFLYNNISGYLRRDYPSHFRPHQQRGLLSGCPDGQGSISCHQSAGHMDKYGKRDDKRGRAKCVISVDCIMAKNSRCKQGNSDHRPGGLAAKEARERRGTRREFRDSEPLKSQSCRWQGPRSVMCAQVFTDWAYPRYSCTWMAVVGALTWPRGSR
jgi:hypothetical protein